MKNEYINKLSNEEILEFLQQFYNISEMEFVRNKYGVHCSNMETAKNGENKINMFLQDDGYFCEIGHYFEDFERKYLKMMVDKFKTDPQYVSIVMNKLQGLEDAENNRHGKVISKLVSDQAFIFGKSLKELNEEASLASEQSSLFDSNDEQLKIETNVQNQPE